jgi:DNA-binding SARP family transcriptional activator
MRPFKPSGLAMRAPTRPARFESKTGFEYRSPFRKEAANRPPTLASALSRPDAASEREVHVRARAGSGVVLRDMATMSLYRSLPARMLETLLRLLHSSEHAQAPAHVGATVAAGEQERARHLVGGLGEVLERMEHAALPASDRPAIAPSLEIYLLSPFRVFANDRAIDDWPNCKGKSIFKYLATHRGQPVPREVLMDLFWPNAEPDAARNNLNVAIYGLRKALGQADPDFSFVLFRQGCYAFNPELQIWVDAEAFVDSVHRAQAAEALGDADAAMAELRVAQSIYRCALLVDDRYEDWLIPQRQALQDSHLKALDRLAAHYFARGDLEACSTTTSRMLEVEPCNEEAHRMLMRCYSRMGHAHLALRQYHFCIDALSRELNLIPSPQTVALYQQIRRRQPI